MPATVSRRAAARSRPQIRHHQVRAGRRDVADHQHHVEELVQEPDVAGDDDDAGNRRHEKFCPFSSATAEREADHLQVRDLRLQLQRVRDDRLRAAAAAARIARQVDLRRATSSRRPAACGKTTGKLIGTGVVLNREGGREVVGLEARLVEDDALLADLVGGQRPRRHLRDEQLLDHLDRRRSPACRRSSTSPLADRARMLSSV